MGCAVATKVADAQLACRQGRGPQSPNPPLKTTWWQLSSRSSERHSNSAMAALSIASFRRPPSPASPSALPAAAPGCSWKRALSSLRGQAACRLSSGPREPGVWGGTAPAAATHACRPSRGRQWRRACPHLQMLHSSSSCCGVRRWPSRRQPSEVLGHLLPGFSGGSEGCAAPTRCFRSTSASVKPLRCAGVKACAVAASGAPIWLCHRANARTCTPT